jgi:hypothetical protein
MPGKNYFILIMLFIIFVFTACSATENKSNTKPNKMDKSPLINLPAIKIDGNYISLNDGINVSDARKLIISKMEKDGVKGDINSVAKINEITTKEAWENVGVQLYSVDVDYAWLNAIAIIKDKKVLAVLSGMPTNTAFLADLDKDGIYEIYTNISMGSGIVSEEIRGYNIALNEHYALSMRMKQDIYLNIENGTLMAEVRPWNKEDKNNTKRGKVILKKNDQKRELAIE